MRLVVADNASTDDTAAWLKQHYPNVELLQLEKNYGFAEGYNQAIQRIDTEFVVLLNQDVETEGDWITPLVNA
jgi:GT2 family glycosyltransferase